MSNESFYDGKNVNDLEKRKFRGGDGNDSVVATVTDDGLEWKLNDSDEVGSVCYVGQAKQNGEWRVTKVDETGDIFIRYATIKNNDDQATYSDAWSNRLTLDYKRIEQL